MLSCKEASRLISQSLDRQLTVRERLSLRFHLLLCDMCTTFRRQLSLIRVAVRRYKTQIENNESIRLSEDAKLRISNSIKID
ncbi:zf-HC2 domain-containing protein [Methyloradius palustris]|uniref:zf-HC2 domain-containing protein n=1 Tax=Methyloradius palustris TaxID=2778876 RepID=UPI001C8C20CE|nr:zf-HC2 domain-containing protein [Methyloradius palustris]